MPLDVSAEAAIRRPAADVAAHMFDPVNDPGWTGGIRSARRLGDPAAREGSRVLRAFGPLLPGMVRRNLRADVGRLRDGLEIAG